MSRFPPKSTLHDKFVLDQHLQPAFAAPEQQFTLPANPVLTKYGEGNPIGAVPRYAEVSKPKSLYTITTTEYPWRPDISNGRALTSSFF